ncbi:MAG: hypothetical protein ACKOQP_04145 [Bacteroidota bacterium]
MRRPSVQSVHNLGALFGFRAFAFVVMAAGAAPMFFMRSDSSVLYGALVGSFLFIILAWNLVKPGYTAVEIAASQILISTDKDDDKPFYLTLPTEELAYFEIRSRSGGLRHDLWLFRQTPQGIMRSKTIRLSLYTPAKVEAVRRILQAVLVSHGRSAVEVNPGQTGSNP